VPVLRRLLLFPLLAPLALVLLVGVLNPRPAYRLRLLVWSSPPLPLGVWITLAGAGGAALSAGATALALRGAGPVLGRRVRQEQDRVSFEGPTAAPSRPRPAAAPEASAAAWSWPKRAPQDPAPTVSVPFRVIRKGTGAPAPAKAPSPVGVTVPSPTAAPAPLGDAAPEESWDSPDQDDW